MDSTISSYDSEVLAILSTVQSSAQAKVPLVKSLQQSAIAADTMFPYSMISGRLVAVNRSGSSSIRYDRMSSGTKMP